MTFKANLADIVGSDYVFDDPETLGLYSKDHSFTPPRKPRLAVKPKNATEVQKIIEWANKTGTPLVPISSGPPRFRGDTVPALGGAVIVDLEQMKQIVRIDRRNKVAIIEPGVTFPELQPELASEGLRLPIPLLPRSSKSVIGSLLEREPTLIPRYHWDISDPLLCTEVIWGNGDKFVTGEAGDHGPLEKQWKLHLTQKFPSGPGQVDYFRFLQGAQGTMGIVTWASLKCEQLPRQQKIFFIFSQKLEDLVNFAYRLLRYRYGEELLILNSYNIAAILEESDEQIRTLRNELPPWALIVCVAGYDLLPDERVEYQEKDIMDIAQQFGLLPTSSIPGGSSETMLKLLQMPSREPYWKLRYKGGCQDIFFSTTLNRTPEFVKTMYSLAESKGYGTAEMGVYIQPVVQGAACHCEFNLPYDPDNAAEAARVRELLLESGKTLIKHGAFFSRPYDLLADMAFRQDAETTIALRKVKGIFDPNNVMNPGKLCF